MITIDGSRGEGGGQILRSSLSLSVITKTPLRLINIRSRRANPGLQPQHLVCCRAAAALAGPTVRMQGDAIGSLELTLTYDNNSTTTTAVSSASTTPSTTEEGPADHRGESQQSFSWDIGSAGSTLLVFQTVFPIAAASAEQAASSSPLRFTITGGTENGLSPSSTFIVETFLPALRGILASAAAVASEEENQNNNANNQNQQLATVRVDRYGFFPAGGGRLRADIFPFLKTDSPTNATADPASSLPDRVCCCDLTSFRLTSFSVTLLLSKIGDLDTRAVHGRDKVNELVAELQERIGAAAGVAASSSLSSSAAAVAAGAGGGAAAAASTTTTENSSAGGGGGGAGGGRNQQRLSKAQQRQLERERQHQADVEQHAGDQQVDQHLHQQLSRRLDNISRGGDNQQQNEQNQQSQDQEEHHNENIIIMPPTATAQVVGANGKGWAVVSRFVFSKQTHHNQQHQRRRGREQQNQQQNQQQETEVNETNNSTSMTMVLTSAEKTARKMIDKAAAEVAEYAAALRRYEFPIFVDEYLADQLTLSLALWCCRGALTSRSTRGSNNNNNTAAGGGAAAAAAAGQEQQQEREKQICFYYQAACLSLHSLTNIAVIETFIGDLVQFRVESLSARGQLVDCRRIVMNETNPAAFLPVGAVEISILA